MNNRDNPLDIKIDIDKVEITNQIVWRPSHMSRSEWLEYWEKVVTPHELD